MVAASPRLPRARVVAEGCRVWGVGVGVEIGGCGVSKMALFTGTVFTGTVFLREFLRVVSTPAEFGEWAHWGDFI